MKLAAVNDYLSGKGSLLDICTKYAIRDTRRLRDWIKMYNTHGELKSRGSYICGVDAIIPESSGFPLTKEFLKKMNHKFF